MISEFISFKIKIIIISISAILVLLIASADLLILNNTNNKVNNEETEISENIQIIGKIALPLEDFITITAKFGFYDPYETGITIRHTGIDLVGKTDCNIIAVEDGEVIISGYMENGYGNYVKIKHNFNGNTIYTLYGHMKNLPLVKVGELVKEGQKIGIQGNTGNSTGPHLHFEIIVGEEKIDPYPYLFEK